MRHRRPLRLLAIPTTILTIAVSAVLVTAGTAVAAPSAAAPSGQCADASLKVRVHYDPEGAGAGQRLSDIDFENVGRSTCELRGAPGVSLVGHGNGTQLGRPADRQQAGTPPTFTLRPGQSARTDLEFEYVDEQGGAYSTSACKPVKADGYRIYPPHSYNSVFVRSPQYACSSSAIHWGSVGYLRTTVGCATTAAHIPAGATRKRIADVDGDLRADTEWITPTRVGITTASGATSSVKPDVAGGADPTVFSVVLHGTSKAITLIAGSRDVQVFRFAGCRLRPVTNVQGDQYRFDLTGTHGTGIGCADPDHNGADQLIGLQLARPLGGLKDGDQDDITATDIGINGLHGVNGHPRTTTAAWPQDQKKLEAAATVTCHALTLRHDGITAHR